MLIYGHERRRLRTLGKGNNLLDLARKRNRMIKKQNIRTLLLATVLSLLTTLSWAVATTDRISFQTAALTPGETTTQYITVVVIGSRTYSALNFDMKVPESIEPVFNNKGKIVAKRIETGILPNDEGEFYHTVSCTYTEADRNLRVSCISTENDEFTANSGVVFKIPFSVPVFTKPGALQIEMSGLNLTTADGTKYEPAAETNTNVSISTEAKAQLSVSAANKWSTCILPFAAELPTGVKAYTSTGKDDTQQVFYLTEAASIEAFTPYVLYSESGYAGTLTGTVDASQYPSGGTVSVGNLTGAIATQTTSEGYILQNKSGAVKFYVADPEKTYTIPAGKCWATPSDSEGDSYGFAIETTAVQTVSDGEAKTNGACYYINGVQTTTPAKGRLYIQNGKKYIK